MRLDKLVYGGLALISLIGYSNLDTLNIQVNPENPVNLSSDKEIPVNLKKQAEIAQKRGIPESVTVAIAVHETGWFRAVIGEGNYFGVKCLGESKDPCLSVQTTESYCKGLCAQDFQSGQNPDFMANVFANTLINLAGLENQSPDEIYKAFTEDFNQTIRAVGRKYATDPNWANKVIQIHTGLTQNQP